VGVCAFHRAEKRDQHQENSKVEEKTESGNKIIIVSRIKIVLSSMYRVYVHQNVRIVEMVGSRYDWRIV